MFAKCVQTVPSTANTPSSSQPVTSKILFVSRPQIVTPISSIGRDLDDSFREKVKFEAREDGSKSRCSKRYQRHPPRKSVNCLMRETFHSEAMRYFCRHRFEQNCFRANLCRTRPNRPWHW